MLNPETKASLLFGFDSNIIDKVIVIDDNGETQEAHKPMALYFSFWKDRNSLDYFNEAIKTALSGLEVVDNRPMFSLISKKDGKSLLDVSFSDVVNIKRFKDDSYEVEGSILNNAFLAPDAEGYSEEDVLEDLKLYHKKVKIGFYDKNNNKILIKDFEELFNEKFIGEVIN